MPHFLFHISSNASHFIIKIKSITDKIYIIRNKTWNMFTLGTGTGQRTGRIKREVKG